MQPLGVVLGFSHHWFEKDTGGNIDKSGYLAGAYYDITKSTRIRASFAHKIRFPSMSQLYDKTPISSNDNTPRGNPDLQEEKSNNYEAGISQRIGEKSSMSLTGFYQTVKNFIERDKDSKYLNHDKYRFDGVELTAETRAVKHLFLKLGYTFMQSKDESPNTGKDELQYRPEHRLTLEGQYDFGHGFSLYMSTLYVGKQYTYSDTNDKKEINTITVVNARVEKSFWRGKMTCYVGVDNLFDDDYYESYGFPQAGSTFYGGIRITN
jgi:outer membrane receptor protein involved in Fe transport